MSEATFATALDSLGQLLPSDPGRDAIHLATYAVTAAEQLFPGQHIGLVEGGVGANAKVKLGIVDPFLPAAVLPGQMFWMVLYPRTITSLRHVWTHPAFEAEKLLKVHGAPGSSERWLHEYADQIDERFDDLMEAADAWVSEGDYYYGDRMIGSGYNGKFERTRTHPDFWQHYEAYKGVKVEGDKQHSFFTCAC